MDVGFLLDSSGSLKRDYAKEKKFLNALAETFGVGKGSRGGVITFSYFVEHTFKLSDHSNIASFKRAVTNIKFMGSTTNIDRALRLSQRKMFKPENGGRANVPDILILLTDGTQSKHRNMENPVKVANELRKSGVTIIAVGIGPGTKKEELIDISGRVRNVFRVSSFAHLNKRNFIERVAEFACKKGKLIMAFLFLSNVNIKLALSSFKWNLVS